MKFPRPAWWVQSPLSRILIAFGFGIGWAILKPERPIFFLIGILFFAPGFFLAFILPARWNRSWQGARGFLLLCLFLFAGGFHMTLQENHSHSRNLEASRNRLWLMTVLSAPIQTRSGIRFEARLSRKTGTDEWQRMQGGCMVYLGNSTADSFKPGTRWAVRGSPSPIPGARNPGSPDFKSYFQTRGIQYQFFLERETLIAVPAKRLFGPSQAMETQKTWILHTLRRNFRDTAILGLAEAILLGNKAHLDPSVNSAFAKTGVMHVIAISGMHLSLIFSMLMALFRFAPAGLLRHLASLLIAIPAIWWFSLLTGGSASAIRSAIMCSLPVTGLVFSRKILSMNNLSASALLMLFYQPLWVKDPGFQLSFAALLGILVWQSSVNRWFRFKNPILKNIWNLISVTLAAQVFTTPLVICYFHQFPLLFLFANICAVPLSSLALILEILLCISSFSDGLSGILSMLCEALLRTLLVSVDGFSRIPGSVLQPLYLDPPLVLFIMLIVLLFKSWLTSRQAPLFLLFIAGTLIIMLSLLFDQWGIRHQHWFAVLHQRNASIIVQVRGRSARIYLATSKSVQTGQLKTTIRQFIQHYRIQDAILVQLPASKNATLKAGQWEIILAQNFHPPPIPQKPNAYRVLVLCGDASGQLQAWEKSIRPNAVVIDGSHALWKIQQWEKEAEKLPLRLHLTPKDGAFLLDYHNPPPYAKKN